MPAKVGRPSTYSRERAAAICEGIASGKSLKSVCSEPGMPSMSTVFVWLAAQDSKETGNATGISEFQEMYARAKDSQADAMTEDMLAIADDPNLDPNDKRIRVDTRKWLASKLKPKKYADRLDQTIEHQGNDVAERLVAGRQRVHEMRKQSA